MVATRRLWPPISSGSKPTVSAALFTTALRDARRSARPACRWPAPPGTLSSTGRRPPWGWRGGGVRCGAGAATMAGGVVAAGRAHHSGPAPRAAIGALPGGDATTGPADPGARGAQDGLAAVGEGIVTLGGLVGLGLADQHMQAVLAMEGDVTGPEADELVAPEGADPAHDQQAPVADPARRPRPRRDLDALDDRFEVGEQQRRLPPGRGRPHPTDPGQRVSHLGVPSRRTRPRKITGLVDRRRPALQGGPVGPWRRPARGFWAPAASARYDATTPASAGNADTPCRAHHEEKRSQSVR